MPRFHTGVAKTHVHQGHTKQTMSRKHPHVDDGGLVGRTSQAEWTPAVSHKHLHHQREEMLKEAKRLGITLPRMAMAHSSLPHTSLGHAPTHRQSEHDTTTA